MPTTENLLVWTWERVVPRVAGARLVRLRLREDVGLWVDYYGPVRDPLAERGPGRVEA